MRIFYFRKVLLFVKFIFSPSSISISEKNIHNTVCVKVDFKAMKLPLIVSFAGLGDTFNFENTLRNFNVNVIYLRDPSHNWYLNGLSGVGVSVQEVVIFLKDKIKEYNASRLITIGSSAGGFGAILYGSLLKADSVLAFSPQTFMSKSCCVLYFDYRWLDRVIQIYNGDKANRAYLDMKPLLLGQPVSVTLIYDMTHRLDNAHASRIKGSTIKHKGMKWGGHTLVKELRNLNLLDELLYLAINSE